MKKVTRGSGLAVVVELKPEDATKQEVIVDGKSVKLESSKEVADLLDLVNRVLPDLNTVTGFLDASGFSGHFSGDLNGRSYIVDIRTAEKGVEIDCRYFGPAFVQGIPFDRLEGEWSAAVKLSGRSKTTKLARKVLVVAEAKVQKRGGSVFLDLKFGPGDVLTSIRQTW